jgi:hypothetical protein
MQGPRLRATPIQVLAANQPVEYWLVRWDSKALLFVFISAICTTL